MQQTAPRQHPAVVLRSQYRQIKSALVVLMVALVSLSVTVVALVADDVGTSKPTAGYFHPFKRINYPERTAGPDESKVAAAISAQPQPQTARPDESKIAAAISKRVQIQRDASRPDESKVAASIGGGFHVFTGRPDEAKVAASVSPSIHHN